MERVTQEKDLGVVIDTGGKQVAQCQSAIGKANRGFRLCSEGDHLYIKRGGVNIVQEFSEGHTWNIVYSSGHHNSGRTLMPSRGFSVGLLD